MIAFHDSLRFGGDEIVIARLIDSFSLQRGRASILSEVATPKRKTVLERNGVDPVEMSERGEERTPLSGW